MKFQLTIATNYCSTWGAWEGCRELVQNGLDAQDDGAEMKVSHHIDTFRVVSQGVKLDARVWLMGTTSKSSGGYRGHFGEGLKLGVLALVRAGHEVKIINGDESWTPKLEASEVFGDEVLTIYTHKRQNDSGAFTIEVSGITKEAWDLMKGRFLFLAKPKNVVETSYAQVLLDEHMKGRVFVKGIFVQNSPDLSAGYNFKQVETDRDRRMISGWDLRYNAAKAWEEAMTHEARPEFIEKVMDLLQSNAPDVTNMGEGYVDAATTAKVGKVFRARHGEKSIPVTSMAGAREAEHYGFKGVVVQSGLMAVLKGEETLNLDKLREEYKKTAQKSYAWADLTEAEQATYKTVLDLVESAAKDLGYGTIEDRLNIVDFGDAALDGTLVGGKIKIAKRLLSDFEEYLSTLVHEVAHAQGGDGTVGHERAEGKLYARIITSQMRN